MKIIFSFDEYYLIYYSKDIRTFIHTLKLQDELIFKRDEMYIRDHYKEYLNRLYENNK